MLMRVGSWRCSTVTKARSGCARFTMKFQRNCSASGPRCCGPPLRTTLLPLWRSTGVLHARRHWKWKPRLEAGSGFPNVHAVQEETSREADWGYGARYRGFTARLWCSNAVGNYEHHTERILIKLDIRLFASDLSEGRTCYNAQRDQLILCLRRKVFLFYKSTFLFCVIRCAE